MSVNNLAVHLGEAGRRNEALAADTSRAAVRALLEQGHPDRHPVTALGQLRRHGTENARKDNRDAGVLLVELCQPGRSVAAARVTNSMATRVRLTAPPRPTRPPARPTGTGASSR